MTARACVRCGTTFDGYGKTRYCSQQCRCGTDAGYNSGCSCNDCRRAHARARNYARMNTRHWVSALGSQRRIRALARLGWSSAELSRRLGKHRSYLLKVMSNDLLEQLTATAIATLYEDLCMTRCTSPTAGRTAAVAASHGWPPPLAWDNIDDPNEDPTGWMYDPSRLHVLVEIANRGGSVSEACRVLEVSREALQKWCGRKGHRDLYLTLAAREAYRPNQYLGRAS